MINKFNKDNFVIVTLWRMYVSKECEDCIITDTQRKGETISETSLMLMSYLPPYHYHKMTYEEYYIWAWQPIVEGKSWQKALINSYIENRPENYDFNLFEYCRDEVLELVKEIEEDRKKYSESEFKLIYYWCR